jgi:hypothetical protein
LFEGKRSTSITADNKHPGWWTLRIDLSPEIIDRIRSNQLSFVLGEFAYQLRAALDGLIWDTITYTQGSELPSNTKGLNRLEFPLSPTWKAKDVDKNCFHGFPFPQDLIDWMKTIQPSTADKPIGHPDLGLQNTLVDIHNLARYDRHRRLRIVSMLPINQRVDILGTEPPGGGAIEHEWLHCNPLDGKYEIMRMKIVCPGGLFPYQVHIKPNVSFTVFAENIEPYDGADIGVQLNRFIGAVSRVINRFDEEFS